MAVDGGGERSQSATVPTVDARGRQVTTWAIYRLAGHLDAAPPGGSVRVVIDNSEAIERDVLAWARMAGHGVADIEDGPTERRITIEKGSQPQRRRRLAMVVSGEGLEETLSPLAFALAGQLSGMHVALYFQGPAVKMLARGHRGRLAGFARPFSRFARRGLEQIGHVPAQEKVRELHQLGAGIYACAPSMAHFDVSLDNLAIDDVVVCEYFTFLEVLAESDISLYAP